MNWGKAPLAKMLSTYIYATCCWGIAFAISIWISRYFVPAPASMFMCAIIVSAWLGGLGPGMWAVALCLLAFDYEFVPPVHSFDIEPDYLPRMVLFSLTTTCIGCLGSLQYRTSKSLRDTRDRLVHTVTMLGRVNEALQRENAEHRRIEEKLRLSEAFLAEGQQISHTGSWRWNIGSHSLFWSDEHYRIYGYPPSSTPPDPAAIRQRIHPADRDLLQQTVRHAIETGSPFECEYRILLPDGTVRYLFGTGRPITWQDDCVTAFIGTTVDITARRMTEELLRKSEKAFRTLAENSPDTIVRYNHQCERIYVNPAFERDCGLLAEYVQDKPLEVGWFADMPVDEYKSLVCKVLATGEPVQLSGIWTQPGHAGEHYAAHLVAERDSEGSIVSALAISRNVTKAKKAELELEESRCLIRELAGRSEAVREEERKHMARELHDSLAQVLLALRLKISVLSLEFGAKAAEIDTRVESMVGLVDDAIKVVRGAITSLRPVTLDLGMVPALEWLVEQFSTDTGIPCEFRSDLPSVSLSEKYTVAVFRIAQEALRNIVRHAAASRARLSLVLEGDFYLLEISDDGRGFDPSKINPKSFGLLGIKERVLMFSGTFQLETAPRSGTVIRIRIPCVASSIES